MNILLVLIPLTLLGLLVAVAMFFWAVNHQQFDDLDNPGVVPLLEDSDHRGPIEQAPTPSPVRSGFKRWKTLPAASHTTPCPTTRHRLSSDGATNPPA